MAVSCLYSVYGPGLNGLDLPFLKNIDAVTLDMVLKSIEKNINCPLSSGAGRLFDAVSALLNVCTVSQFHAEAPMRLETAARPGEEGSYPYAKGEVIGTGPVIESIVKDIREGVDVGLISSRFHNTVCSIILDTVTGIEKDRGIQKVALSGGSFQNRYVSARIENQLGANGFEVLLPLQLPANDGGIALGQLAVAAKHRSLGLI
jgi:hydrogenase maturation protein HypF